VAGAPRGATLSAENQPRRGAASAFPQARVWLGPDTDATTSEQQRKSPSLDVTALSVTQRRVGNVSPSNSVTAEMNVTHQITPAHVPTLR
jgi:hypothetical protein